MSELLQPADLRRALPGLLASLVEQSTNLVMLCGEAGEIHYINPAGASMLGVMGVEELAGLKAWEVQSTFSALDWNDQLVHRLQLCGKWEGDLTLLHRRHKRAILTECQALLLPGGLWYAIHAVPLLEAEFGKPVLLNITSTTRTALAAAPQPLKVRPDPKWGKVMGSF